MAFNFTGKSELYHSFCDNQVILHMKPQVHVAGGCMTCISHCPQPGAVHKYCLHNTEHIFNFMLIYDKEKKLKASSRTVWNLLIVSHTINLSVGSKSPFQVEALQAQARRSAWEPPDYKGHKAEGKLPETSFWLRAMLVRWMKSFWILSLRVLVCWVRGTKWRKEARKPSAGQAGWSLRWNGCLGPPWTAPQNQTQGLPNILLALPLFLVALISSPLPWPSDLPVWRKQSDCLE